MTLASLPISVKIMLPPKSPCTDGLDNVPGSNIVFSVDIFLMVI